MKLIACHVENFGKLSDFSMNFNEGINVINQSNAWGKSTLAAFLKAMFYGLDAKKDAKAFDKERNIYRPWQGGAFGGEVDFEVNGKCYRISRTFGDTEKKDEFHLYDLATNLKSNDFTEQVGVELFDLDSASFKRSIYIAQNDCMSETSDSINAKLGNLAENTDDINNFESASRQLKEILNQLTPDRVTGSLKSRKNYMTQLTQEIRSFDAAKEGFEGVQQKENIVASQIKELIDIRRNYAAALVVASEDSRRKELYAQYDALCQEVNEKEEKINSFKSVFPAEVPAPEEFQEQMQYLRSMEDAKVAIRGFEFTDEENEAWDKLEEMFAKEVPEEANIDFSLETLVATDKQKEEIARQDTKLSFLEEDLAAEVVAPKFKGIPAGITFMVLGLLTAAASGGLFVAWYMQMLPAINVLYFGEILIAGIALGVLLATIGLVVFLNGSKNRKAWEQMTAQEYAVLQSEHDELKSAIEAMKEDVRKVHSTIGAFLGRFHVYCTVEDYQSKLYELKGQAKEYLRLKEKLENGTGEKATYRELCEKMLNFARGYSISLGDDLAEGLTNLQNKATEYQLAVNLFNEICRKREAFEKAQEPSFWTREAFCPYSIDELNEMIAQADEKMDELKRARASYSKQLDELQEQMDLRDEKADELDELQKLQETETKQYELIKVTHDFLQKAKENLTAHYLEPISKGFAKYYQMLTGDTSDNWIIDANINLKVREYGELREVKWLSAGYQDLIGVCMRLALVEAMYEAEKPFLILDDPFVNLDEKKVEAGNHLLKNVSEEYQVIYFTCHDSRSPQ